MAIDYGKKRMGIAITDPMGIIAQPYLTINYRTKKEILQRLKSLIDEKKVKLVVVGYPISLNNEPTSMSEEVLKFVKQLGKLINTQIIIWDERFSTKLAMQISKDYKCKVKEVDRISASLILEDFLKQLQIQPDSTAYE